MGNVIRYFLLIGFMEFTVGSHLGSRGGGARCWPGLSNWTAGSRVSAGPTMDGL